MLWLLDMVHFHFTPSMRAHHDQLQNYIPIIHNMTFGLFQMARKFTWSRLLFYM